MQGNKVFSDLDPRLKYKRKLAFILSKAHVCRDGSVKNCTKDILSHMLSQTLWQWQWVAQELLGFFSYSLRQIITRSKGHLSKLISQIVHFNMSPAVVHGLRLLGYSRTHFFPFSFLISDSGHSLENHVYFSSRNYYWGSARL